MGLRVLGFRVLGFRVWVFGSRLGFSRLGPSGPLAKKGFRASSAQVTLGFRRFASGASGVLRFFVTWVCVALQILVGTQPLGSIVWFASPR